MNITPTRTYTLPQLVFASLVVLVFAVLTYTEKVSGDATIALVSGVAAPLAAKASQEEARANGIKEGVEASYPTEEAEH